MDPERRAKLLKKRSELQGRIEHAEFRARIAYTTNKLREAGVAFDYLDEPLPLSHWLQTSFPFGKASIDWQQVEHRHLPRDAGDDAVREWLEQVAIEQGLVTVLYGAFDPGLVLAWGDFVAQHAVLARWECWLIPPQREWVIEHSEDGWYWTRVPSA